LEIPVEKCEYKDEQNEDGEYQENEKSRICAEYLKDVTHTLGTGPNSEVFALYDYLKNRDDELDFSAGDRLVIVRRGDDVEREWWWARKVVGKKVKKN